MNGLPFPQPRFPSIGPLLTYCCFSICVCTHSCERVDSIRVVWSENGTVPNEEKDKEWFSSKKRVFYDKYTTTSLNNRFVPPEGLETDSVFAVDDDIRVPCSDLDFAYEVSQVSHSSPFLLSYSSQGSLPSLFNRCGR